MHSLVYCALFVVSLTTVLEAATVSQIVSRIISEQSFVQSSVSDQKSNIASDISSTKSSLNALAEALKTKQRNAGKPCDVFVQTVEDIQKSSINFLYQFQSCEMTSELFKVSNVKNSLSSLSKTAQNLGILCASFPSASCQSRIDSMDRDLDTIHNSVVSDLSRISSDSKRCIDGKRSNAESSLQRNEGIWSKCVSKN